MTVKKVCTVDWDLGRDSDNHRTYKLIQRIETDDYDMSPIQVLDQATESVLTGGIPERGDYWTFGSNDLWAFCTGEMELVPEFLDGDQSLFWKATSEFSSVPNDASGGGSGGAENPVLDLPKVTGGVETVTEQQRLDRNGDPLENSAFEPLLGDATSKAVSHATVTIEINQLDSPFQDEIDYINHVNSEPMWGYQPRHIKLLDLQWEKIILTDGFVYYRISFMFGIKKYDWDIPVMDEGTKVLIEGGDKDNPGDFRRVTDEGTDEKESKPVLLDGAGNRLPAGDNPFFHVFEIEEEYNFLNFNIPGTI